MSTILWNGNPPQPDPFGGDDMRSRLVRALRRTLEEALPDGFGPNSMSRSFVYDRLLEQPGIGPRLPARASFYNAFELRTRGKTVAQCLEAAGVDPDVADALGQQVDEVRRGSGISTNVDSKKHFAEITKKVREAYCKWDTAEPNDVSYRDPELALAPEDLSTAYEAALAGSLTADEVAYCLYSAIKHSKNYKAWVELCPGSESAAEAMLDLILIPKAGQQVRPVHRAAWTMQQLDPVIRTAAAEVGACLAHGRHDGVLTLLEAAKNSQVEQLLQTRLEIGYYSADDAGKIRALLEQEWADVQPRRGARGVVRAFLENNTVRELEDVGSDQS